MSDAPRERLFGVVMFGTAVTSIFAWLPLIRILGRAEGYQWQIGPLGGTGTEGPFWIFIPLTAGVVLMLYAAFRLPRAVFYPMLLAWHALVASVASAGAASDPAATMQGQGLGFSISLGVVAAVAVGLFVLSVVWVVLDRRAGGVAPADRWLPANTRRLAASLALLLVALVLFRLGTNYNWVTSAAIFTTVAHWILLIQAFAPAGGVSRPADRG